MHQYPTPHTWMHWNHHPSSKCNGILPLTHECTANCHSSGKCTNIPPLTHECTDIIIPQVNAQESYPSHMNAPKSSFLMWLHRYPTPHTWMHRHHHPSSKCTRIMNVPPIVTPQVNAPISHPKHKIIIPQVNAPESYPSHMNAPQIVFSQVNATISHLSHMNAPKSSSLK